MAALNQSAMALEPTNPAGDRMYEGRLDAGIEELDVLIIGAGLSGIGAAYYLKTHCPDKTFTLLEARDNTGGTWDLFRYPGIRSDSDLHTFGYEFKPWVNKKSIAGAAAILAYLREAASEHGINPKIRFRHKVVSAAWSSESGRWEVIVCRGDHADTLTMRCRWLFWAGGYYSYEGGFDPELAGAADFKGRIVHQQAWPQDLDYRNKKVVVIGSGATAVTLVPAMAASAAHVTMLQRTPTYVMTVPSEDRLAIRLRKWLPAKLAYRITRGKNIFLQRNFWRFCQKYPGLARRLIRWATMKQLPEGYPVDVHFNPPYNPWDQRLCAVPDGDLFKVLGKGSASIVTDRIERITPTGIRLVSGNELDADVIVKATGLNLQMFGGINLKVDGEEIDLTRTVAFKGMMLSGIPNLAFAIGYTNSSWTLKVGLLCEHFCRLLRYMDDKGYERCRPAFTEPMSSTRPLLDFGAGYVQRSLRHLPRQGMGYPWVMSMSYAADVKSLRNGPVEDPNLHFETNRSQRHQSSEGLVIAA